MLRTWILWPAVTMSLGWGLRGFIGGGPLGAMIPGALVALCLCLLLDRDHDDAAVIAAWGAVGIGFGGQMTYGQTIGLALDPATRAWGLTGLALKGAIWGFLGGAVIALALVRHRFPPRRIVVGLALMCVATYAGWRLFNEPKLVYFSNRLDRPRPEIWFGLAAGAFAVLAWLRDATLWRFAAAGAVSGGIGFGCGGYIQVLGRDVFPADWAKVIGYWKAMEFFLGAMLGAGLGYSAWRHRGELRSETRSVTPGLAFALLAPLALAAVQIPGRATYTYLGAVLLAMAMRWPAAARHIAITMTYCAFSIDFLRSRKDWDPAPIWVFIAAGTAAVAWAVERWPSARAWFQLLAVTAVANSLGKSYLPGFGRGLAQDIVETVFVLMLVAALWMLPRRSMAALAAGCLVLAASQGFVAMDTGIAHTTESNRSLEKYLPESMVGGVAMIDYDGDGRLDLFFVNGAVLGEKPVKPDARYWNRLYRNEGGWKFRDVTAKAGVAGQSYGMGVAVGDYDNDGDPDLFVTGLGANELYRNNGDGTFSDVTARAGVAGGGWSAGAAFVDYDNDGLLDLAVSRYLEWSYRVNPYCGDRKPGYRSYCHPNQFGAITHLLYRNKGDGTFADVSKASGFGAAPGKGLGVALGDLDRDGWTDIFVANDSMPQQLFRNAAGARFEDVGLARGVAYDDDGRVFAGMGAAFDDYDNDGWPDIFVNALAHQRYGLFRNVKGVFEYVSGPTGMGEATVRHSGWGAALADFDNDGRRDLFVAQGHVMDNIELTNPNLRYLEPPLLLRNTGARFERAAWDARPMAARGAAFGDLDNDGALDIAINVKDDVPVVLRNAWAGGRHWIALDLVGARCNRDAVGARVILTAAGGARQYAMVSAAGSYLSANALRVHFGLGADTEVASIEILWPGGGAPQRLEKIAADRVVRVTQPR